MEQQAVGERHRGCTGCAEAGREAGRSAARPPASRLGLGAAAGHGHFAAGQRVAGGREGVGHRLPGFDHRRARRSRALGPRVQPGRVADVGGRRTLARNLGNARLSHIAVKEGGWRGASTLAHLATTAGGRESGRVGGVGAWEAATGGGRGEEVARMGLSWLAIAWARGGGGEGSRAGVGRVGRRARPTARSGTPRQWRSSPGDNTGAWEAEALHGEGSGSGRGALPLCPAGTANLG